MTLKENFLGEGRAFWPRSGEKKNSSFTGRNAFWGEGRAWAKETRKDSVLVTQGKVGNMVKNWVGTTSSFFTRTLQWDYHWLEVSASAQVPPPWGTSPRASGPVSSSINKSVFQRCWARLQILQRCCFARLSHWAAWRDFKNGFLLYTCLKATGLCKWVPSNYIILFLSAAGLRVPLVCNSNEARLV